MRDKVVQGELIIWLGGEPPFTDDRLLPPSGGKQRASKLPSITLQVEFGNSPMEQRMAGKPVHVNIRHTNVLGEAEALRERIESRFKCVELYLTDFGRLWVCRLDLV